MPKPNNWKKMIFWCVFGALLLYYFTNLFIVDYHHKDKLPNVLTRKMRATGEMAVADDLTITLAFSSGRAHMAFFESGGQIGTVLFEENLFCRSLIRITNITVCDPSDPQLYSNLTLLGEDSFRWYVLRADCEKREAVLLNTRLKRDPAKEAVKLSLFCLAAWLGKKHRKIKQQRQINGAQWDTWW